MITDRIQELMANPDMGKLWSTYATLALTHADSINEAYEDGYFDRPHATTYCSYAGCRRQVAYKAQLVEPSNPFKARAYSTFAFGYAIELLVKAQMIEAGIRYSDHQSFPLHWRLDGEPIYCSPDAYDVELDGRRFVVEIKSMTTRSFASLASKQRPGIRNRAPGYYDQVQLEIAATGADAGIIVVQNKDTAHLYEEVIEPDEQRLAELDALFLAVHAAATPEVIERPFALKEHPLKHRGKTPPQTINPLRERYDKNNKLIGWDEIVGYGLPWQCRYCGWNTRCWAPKTLIVSYDPDDEDRITDVEVR